MNVYTHLEAGDVKNDFLKIVTSKSYDICGYMRKPDNIAPETSSDEDEGEVDFAEEPDDAE